MSIDLVVYYERLGRAQPLRIAGGRPHPVPGRSLAADSRTEAREAKGADQNYQPIAVNGHTGNIDTQKSLNDTASGQQAGGNISLPSGENIHVKFLCLA